MIFFVRANMYFIDAQQIDCNKLRDIQITYILEQLEFNKYSLSYMHITLNYMYQYNPSYMHMIWVTRI